MRRLVLGACAEIGSRATRGAGAPTARRHGGPIEPWIERRGEATRRTARRRERGGRRAPFTGSPTIDRHANETAKRLDPALLRVYKQVRVGFDEAMTEETHVARPPRFLSRRAILKISAASPIALFALSPSVRAEMQQAGAKLFSSKLEREKFYKAAEKLWETFEKAVEKRARDLGIDITIGEGVFAAAIALSGPKLFENLECFDEHGDEMGTATHTCANYCGTAAVDAVRGRPDPKTIDPSVFSYAWSVTRQTYESRKCQVDTLREQKGQGQTEPSSAPVRVWAFGC